MVQNFVSVKVRIPFSVKAILVLSMWYKNCVCVSGITEEEPRKVTGPAVKERTFAHNMLETFRAVQDEIVADPVMLPRTE